MSARLTDRLPGHPVDDLLDIAPQTLYPVAEPQASGSASTEQAFPTSLRFALPLPPALADGSPLPGTLNLGAGGEVRWEVQVRLALLSGEVITERVTVEGTPPDVCTDQTEEEPLEAESVLERDGVRVRLVLACSRPRLGAPVRVGVEVRPKGRSEKRTGVAGLAAQPSAAETLRPLRRMRLELIRSVDIIPGPEDSAAGTTHSPSKTHIHTTVLHASGKSLRYPGATAPPLRLLFTLPTAQLHPGAIATGGETTARTPYHSVRFKVRATLGFGVPEQQPGLSRVQDERGDWAVEQEITIRPATWHEPRAVVIERGLQPELGTGDVSQLELVDEDEREAYRRKGRDVVGEGGTTRVDGPSGGAVDQPPSFGEATEAPGPSGTQSAGDDDNALPSFTESEAQMRSGAVPLLNQAVPSERLVPVSFTPDDGIADVRAAQRRSSFSGELGTWIEVGKDYGAKLTRPSTTATRRSQSHHRRQRRRTGW